MATYSLKDVVLALRNEYIENQKRLNDLKKYITFVDKKIIDCNFFEYQTKLKEYIELELVKNESAIKRLYDMVCNRNKKVSVTPVKHNISINKKTLDKKVITDSTGTKKMINIYKGLENDERYLVVPNNEEYKINDANSLYAYTDQIMSTPFYQFINSVIELPEEKMGIIFGESGMSINSKENADHSAASIRYDALNDRVLFTPHTEEFYPDQFLQLFETKIDEQLLPSYHKDVVLKNEGNSKALKVEGFKLSTHTQLFKVKDKEKDVVLKIMK